MSASWRTGGPSWNSVRLIWPSSSGTCRIFNSRGNCLLHDACATAAWSCPTSTKWYAPDYHQPPSAAARRPAPSPASGPASVGSRESPLPGTEGTKFWRHSMRFTGSRTARRQTSSNDFTKAKFAYIGL